MISVYPAAMRHAAVPVLAVLLLLCAACSDSRGTGGLQLGQDGATFDTAEAAKRKAERLITRAIADEVGVTWRCSATLAEEPAWDAADEQWRWDAVTATVTLAGSGPAPDEPGIRAAVVDYLAKHQRRGAPAPAVGVHIENQGAAPATSGPAARSAPTDGWRYTLQAGDTLAQLSSAFYGSPQHWRRILDANPGLRAEQLPVGTAIVILPAP